MAKTFFLAVVAALALATPATALNLATAPDLAATLAARDDDQRPAGQPPAKGDAGKSGKQDEPPRWKWWLRADSRQDLALSDIQAKQIDEIFESTMPNQRERWHQLESLEKSLEVAIKEAKADIPAITAQVQKVEQLRAEVTLTRTVMIYRMHRLLTPEQRAKVEAMRQRDQERRRESNGRR